MGKNQDLGSRINIPDPQHCPHLTKLGLTVLDLTKPGWTPTEANILALPNEIKAVPDTSNIPVIMDLLGNYGFRYEQTDSTQELVGKAVSETTNR